MSTRPASTSDVFEKSADLGLILGRIVVDTMKSLTAINNNLMLGDSVEGGRNDIIKRPVPGGPGGVFVPGPAGVQEFLADGSFVDFQGVDKNAVIDTMNTFLLAKSINQLWRQQRVYILGGGKCGDGQGIGSGPKNATVCRDGQAWYIYHWQQFEGSTIFDGNKWRGYVTPPPGAEKLGEGEFSGITIEASHPSCGGTLASTTQSVDYN